MFFPFGTANWQTGTLRCELISCSSFFYRFDHKSKTVMWVFLKFFVEDHDNVIDLMSKFQPDPVCNSRDIIKTPVHCKLLFCIVVGYSPCLEVATCQGRFEWSPRSFLDMRDMCSISRSIRMTCFKRHLSS
jgi:hypothetical protein